ncbi:MAG: hypothetical protein HY688_02955 [Chloroflexi bacterium]|nr:hypothetical protein [Chloroflexota bacterium]
MSESRARAAYGSAARQAARKPRSAPTTSVFMVAETKRKPCLAQRVRQGLA